MELSLLLAKVFGLYMVIVGLFWIVRRDFMLEVAQDYYKSPAIVLFTGVAALLIGLLIVAGHPVFELNWRGLITLIGILTLLKGFLRIFALDYGKHLVDRCLKKGTYQTIGIVTILIGLFLAYHGFKTPT